MANYTDSLGFFKNSAAYPAKGNDSLSVISVDLDFAEIAAARAAASAVALANGDTLEVLPLPAGTLVLAAGGDVSKAEGATATIDLGDSGSATRFLSNLDLNAVADTASALSNPHFYASATTVRITLDHDDIDQAVVRLWFVVVNCSD
jgi:urease accessory protein UreE